MRETDPSEFPVIEDKSTIRELHHVVIRFSFFGFFQVIHGRSARQRRCHMGDGHPVNDHHDRRRD
jgi:hypothetical protein